MIINEDDIDLLRLRRAALREQAAKADKLKYEYMESGAKGVYAYSTAKEYIATQERKYEKFMTEIETIDIMISLFDKAGPID